MLASSKLWLRVDKIGLNRRQFRTDWIFTSLQRLLEKRWRPRPGTRRESVFRRLQWNTWPKWPGRWVPKPEWENHPAPLGLVARCSRSTRTPERYVPLELEISICLVEANQLFFNTWCWTGGLAATALPRLLWSSISHDFCLRLAGGGCKNKSFSLGFYNKNYWCFRASYYNGKIAHLVGQNLSQVSQVSRSTSLFSLQDSGHRVSDVAPTSHLFGHRDERCGLKNSEYANFPSNDN